MGVGYRKEKNEDGKGKSHIGGDSVAVDEKRRRQRREGNCTWGRGEIGVDERSRKYSDASADVGGGKRVVVLFVGLFALFRLCLPIH